MRIQSISAITSKTLLFAILATAALNLSKSNHMSALRLHTKVKLAGEGLEACWAAAFTGAVRHRAVFISFEPQCYGSLLSARSVGVGVCVCVLCAVAGSPTSSWKLL